MGKKEKEKVETKKEVRWVEEENRKKLRWRKKIRRKGDTEKG